MTKENNCAKDQLAPRWVAVIQWTILCTYNTKPQQTFIDTESPLKKFATRMEVKKKKKELHYFQLKQRDIWRLKTEKTKHITHTEICSLLDQKWNWRHLRRTKSWATGPGQSWKRLLGRYNHEDKIGNLLA